MGQTATNGHETIVYQQTSPGHAKIVSRTEHPYREPTSGDVQFILTDKHLTIASVVPIAGSWRADWGRVTTLALAPDTDP